MIKKILSITAIGLVTTLTASALLSGNTDFSAVVEQARKVPAPSANVSISAEPATLSALDAARLEEEAVANMLGSVTDSKMQIADPEIPGAFDELMNATATFSREVAKVAPAFAPGSRAVAKPEGAYIAKDLNTQGATYSASMSIAPKTDSVGNEIANTYEVYNIYGTESVVDMTIDPATGAVEIPCQLLLRHSTYGDVKICPMGVTETGGFSFSDKDPVTGTIDENGVITLGRWGVIITEEGNYRGRGFNFFVSSEWKPANATVKAHNIRTDENIEYPILVEQNGVNEAIFYCLSGVTNEILSARLTSNATAVMSPQKVYTNAMYGDFYIYPCNWNVTNPRPDDKSNLIFSAEGSTLKTQGWAIAAKVLPSQYIGYGNSDVVITLDKALEFPAKTQDGLKGEGTEASPYQVSSLADLKLLSSLVEGGNNFAGKYIALTADIDCSGLGLSEYVPVGDAVTPFAGTFDGGNHTVSGLKLDNKGFTYTGIFGYVAESGTVKNLKAHSVQMTTVGADLGTIVGFNQGTIDNCHVTSTALHSDGDIAGGIAGGSFGTISNCSFNGSVTAIGSAAGIVGQAYGTIKNCSSSANITVDGYVSSAARDAAGIAGTLFKGEMINCYSTGVVTDSYGMSTTAGLIGRASSSTVSNSFSTAAISAKRISADNDTYTGGLAGYVSDSRFDDCFFAGTIVKTDRSEMVGGLCGYLGVGYQSSGSSPTEMINKTIFTNCYSSGSIITPSTNAKKGIYGSTFVSTVWSGAHPETFCFNNVYFDQQINSFTDETWGRPTSFFTNGLLENFPADKWIAEKGKYPVLTNYKASSAAELAAAPLLLQDGQTAKKVKGYFEWTPGTNLDWTVNDESLTVNGNRATVGKAYTNAIVQTLTKDKWSIKLYQLAIVPKLFDGEGTEADPYLIKDVKDFVTLNEAVSTYSQEHEGDFFAMANDIDFKSTDDFHGVGFGMSANVKFGGVFDGRGHSIHGLKIDAPVIEDGKTVVATSVSYTGLFNLTSDKAVIKNLVMAADNDFRFYAYASPFVGANNGVIENCFNYAPVLAFNSYVGTFAGLNNGVVRNCYNAGNLTSCSTNAGGIVGYNNPTGLIDLCQNDGNVIAESIEGVNATMLWNTYGGITGYNYGTLNRSVNNGVVRANNTVGGIAGVTNGYNGAGSMTANINNGQVETTASCTTRGAIVGELRSDAILTANYYDNAVNVNGGANNNDTEGTKGLSTSELVSATTLAGISSDDVDFSAGTYPVLKAYKDQEATKALRGIYVNFEPKQRRTNVTKAVTLSNAEGLAWTLGEESKAFSISGNTLNVTVPTDMTVGAGELTAKLGEKFTKTYQLSSIPSILKGSGTAEEPYLIETPKDWNSLADFVEASGWEYPDNYFRIENDLDFAGDSIRVIAVNGVNFQAVLDGNGKTIKNYVYNNINSIKTRLQGPNLYVGKNIGLIGTLGAFGVVKNFTADGQFTAYQLLGGIVGENYGRIENVTFKGTLANTSSTGVAGIAYRTWEGSVITGCVNEGSVTAKTTTAAGIVVETKKNSLIENCINRGQVASTTSGTAGIVYNAYGAVKGCINEAPLKGTGISAGIAMTGYPNSSFEDCHNRADLDFVTDLAKPGGSIYGIVGTLNTRKATDADLSGGYVKNCSNTGNLSGGDGIYGFGNNVKVGWTIDSVYNTGNITSTGLGCGLFNVVSEFSNGAADWLTTVRNSYNTGNIVANKAGVGGIASQLYNYGLMENVYNTGSIENANTGLTTGGIVSKNNGKLLNSFNAGDINAAGNAVGGLVGYISDGKPDYYGEIDNCFNLGNVISTYTGTNTNGTAGGLVGYFAGTNLNPEEAIHVTNSFNAGLVMANNRVAGISAGAFRPSPVVKDCYNSGRIVCLQPDAQGRYYWSGTTFTNTYTYVANGDTTIMLANHSNCFYDATVNPGAQFRNVTGSAKTTSQLRDLQISDAFVAAAHGGYPVLKAFADDHAAQLVSAALLVLYDEQKQDHTTIGDDITLVGPANAVWSAAQLAPESSAEAPAYAQSLVPTAAVEIENGKAVIRAKAENVVLVCATPEGFKKTFLINVDPNLSSVETIDNGGKEIESVIYIDLQGRIVATPVNGQIYIVRTNYTDGTSNVAKMVVRN